MTNDEIPKYPREIRRSKPQVEGEDWDTLFRRDSRFVITSCLGIWVFRHFLDFELVRNPG
jgi:hypothetical protein